MTDAARWKATVYVGGLASMVTADSLHDAFLPFGEIAEVSLPRNDNPNRNPNHNHNHTNTNNHHQNSNNNADGEEGPPTHRGFAYVEYEDADDAREAIDNMDQAEFYGRVLRVSAAKPPKSAEEGLGSKTAVWEQVCVFSLCFVFSHFLILLFFFFRSSSFASLFALYCISFFLFDVSHHLQTRTLKLCSCLLTTFQEGWLAEHAVSEEDKLAADRAKAGGEQERPDDPMQGLEGLDVAGPKPE